MSPRKCNKDTVGMGGGGGLGSVAQYDILLELFESFKWISDPPLPFSVGRERVGYKTIPYCNSKLST